MASRLGADAYLVKPVSPRLLQAVVAAVLQRPRPVAPPEGAHTYADGYLTINLVNQQVQVCGQPIQLTPLENKLLTYLVRHADTVRPYSEILDKVFQRTGEREVNTVHVYVAQLRRKLEKAPKAPHYLITAHGLGY